MKIKISPIIEGGAYQQAIIFRLEGGGLHVTNEEFLCAVEAELKERNLSLYKLQERIDEDIIKESTFYSLFHDRRTVRIEYIIEIFLLISTSQVLLFLWVHPYIFQDFQVVISSGLFRYEHLPRLRVSDFSVVPIVGISA